MLHIEVCEKLGITRQALSEKLGIAKSTVDSWSSNPERMSQTAKVAMELMLETHELKNCLGKVFVAKKALEDYFSNSGDTGFGGPISIDLKNLLDRMRFVLGEFDLNSLTAAKFMGGEMTFEKFDKVLSGSQYPDDLFLAAFAHCFSVSEKWLFSGQSCPFDRKFIQSNFTGELAEEVKLKNYKAYIVHSTSDGDHTRIVVEKGGNAYEAFKTMFCIGRFIMGGIENSDLFNLYKFYQDTKFSTELLVLEKDEYDKLFSGKYYARNILKRGKTSFMLGDLFDLSFDYSSNYDPFFKECREIIEYELDREKKARK